MLLASGALGLYKESMSEILQVRVSREGKELGVFPVAEAIRMLKEGALLPTDFYWCEGMTDWAPLAQLFCRNRRKSERQPSLPRSGQRKPSGSGRSRPRPRRRKIARLQRLFGLGWRSGRRTSSHVIAAKTLLISLLIPEASSGRGSS